MIVSMLNVMPSHSRVTWWPISIVSISLGGSGSRPAITGFFSSFSSGIAGHHQGDEPEEGQAEQQADAVGPEDHGDADGDDGEHDQADDRGRAIIWLRVGCSPDAMILSSQYSVARWLSRPSTTPPAMQPASRHSPSWPAIQNAATTSAERPR